MKRRLIGFGIGLAGILALFALVFLVYVNDYSRASERAKSKLISTEAVTVVEESGSIAFVPNNANGVGVIFYPGGKVEYTAYSRTMHALAEQGVTTIIVKMPFNLAMFNVNGADAVVEAYTTIERWYMAGHSLGGVFASEYMMNAEEIFEGMVFMASYPNSDFSELPVKMLSINGTNDTVLNSEAFTEALVKFSENTTFIAIEGGNHAQFGDYGHQKGDSIATITRDEQQKQLVDAMIEFLE